MSGRNIKAHVGIGAPVTATALVASDDFSARYDLDRLKGVFSRPAHKLCGESYVGKVLVLNTAKGGVATAWMLYEMKSRGMAPAALLLNAANPMVVTRSPPRRAELSSPSFPLARLTSRIRHMPLLPWTLCQRWRRSDIRASWDFRVETSDLIIGNVDVKWDTGGTVVDDGRKVICLISIEGI